jgi:hypothetical protein
MGRGSNPAVISCSGLVERKGYEMILVWTESYCHNYPDKKNNKAYKKNKKEDGANKKFRQEEEKWPSVLFYIITSSMCTSIDQCTLVYLVLWRLFP